MNKRWPQQEAFCQRVKQFCKDRGLLTPRGAVRWEEAADLFNLSEETLRQFMQYKSKRRPHFDTLAYIAKVMGVAVYEFTGVPGDSPPGVTQEKWNEIPENERLFASSVFDDVMANEMSNEEKQELFRAYKEAKERILRLKNIRIVSCSGMASSRS